MNEEIIVNIIALIIVLLNLVLIYLSLKWVGKKVKRDDYFEQRIKRWKP